MELAPSVEARIEAIRSDATHGASWLSRQALAAVALAAEAPADGPESLMTAIRAALDSAAAARPEMIPIRYWVERLRRAVDDLSGTTSESTALKLAVVAKANDLIAESEETNRRAAANAIVRLAPDSTIFTASYSQTVVDSISQAGKAGKLNRVLIAESIDPSGHVYGRLLAAAVGDTVPRVDVVPDAEISRYAGDVDRIWLGVDTVLPDGSLLNGTPSLALARAAHAAGKPVELIGESAKIDFPGFDVQSQPTPLPSGPAGMERVPSDLIDLMIAEDGPIYWPLTPYANLSAAELTARLAERLLARGEKVGVVESGAGGRIGDLLTDRPGSSGWFAGSLTAYSNASKVDLASVPADVIATFGAVSSQTAVAFAKAAVARFAAAWGVGETGIAGPQVGRRSAKGAGLVHLAVAGPNGLLATRDLRTHHDDRAANKQDFALAALRLLADTIERVARAQEQVK
ncbi:MAG TPA: nicotinamide-nucleotide amidohydrolase family protein [Chloroflexota bacterium]|nr:nicotinamide-nucleotide amidohydrolase family protein [Chloroflexota bacterium]